MMFLTNNYAKNSKNKFYSIFCLNEIMLSDIQNRYLYKHFLNFDIKKWNLSSIFCQEFVSYILIVYWTSLIFVKIEPNEQKF